ncbi:MAG TPA: hypothetical protein VH678_28840 [Xanthobacteraceae bacterium]|jgi:hypothetical protein
MPAALFLPTARQTNWLLIIGFAAFGEALYVRYFGIENSQLGLACQSGLHTWMCSTRALTVWLFTHTVLGWAAVLVAALQLLRPSVLLLSAALIPTAFGLVLHNTNLSGLAAALLTLSLARPAPAPE